MTRTVLTCSVLLIGLFAFGCGTSQEFNVSSSANVQQLIPPPDLSGQTTDVQFNTLLAPQVQTQGQTPVLLEDQTVPVQVTDFRFSGFNSEGRLIFGPLVRAKSASVLLNEMPIEVVNLRVELLVGSLVVGGVALPVSLQANQTTIITNPTFLFPGIDSGEPGEPGPPGPPGPPVDGSTAYGSFTFLSDQQFSGGGPLTGVELSNGDLLDLPTVLASVGGVERSSFGVYSVEQAGDYLVTYQIELASMAGVGRLLAQGEIENQARLLLRVGGAVSDRVIFNDETFQPVKLTIQSILSLEGGEPLTLQFCQPDCVQCEQGFAQGTLSIIRIGESSNSPLPDLDDDCSDPDQ